MKRGKAPVFGERVPVKIPGFDELVEGGIPQGSSILIAGGPGTGKTIFCLQALYGAALEGSTSLYLTMEELPKRLVRHMGKFGWSAEIAEETDEGLRLRAGKGTMLIRRLDPLKAARSIEALLAKKTGELAIDLSAADLLPLDPRPHFITVDSLSAIESAFVGRPESYRIYIEQLFHALREVEGVSFLITETEEAPSRFSRSGVEEFLADGVVVLYNMRVGDSRVRAVEVLKLRGAKHLRKLVPLEITEKGIVIFPEEKVYGVSP
jgi:KaiC/GvpD/RAD55 family RecA-like ATPase